MEVPVEPRIPEAFQRYWEPHVWCWPWVSSVQDRRLWEHTLWHPCAFVCRRGRGVGIVEPHPAATLARDHNRVQGKLWNLVPNAGCLTRWNVPLHKHPARNACVPYCSEVYAALGVHEWIWPQAAIWYNLQASKHKVYLRPPVRVQDG